MRGTSGSEREVWEATGAARRSEARRDAVKLPAGVSQDRQALFRPFPGSPAAEGTDAGRGAGSGGLWKLAPGGLRLRDGRFPRGAWRV